MDTMIVVKGVGPKKAKICIVGDAPSREDELIGKPFVDGAGRLLDELLFEAGIQREECYLDNVVQTRPPLGEFGIYYEDKARKNPTDALRQAHLDLYDRIRERQPNIVIALGTEALRALSHQNLRVADWRGGIIPSGVEVLKVIPTYRPVAVLRNWKWRQIVVADLMKAKKESASSKYEPPLRVFNINPYSLRTFYEWKDELLKGDLISFDIEAPKKSTDTILCIGFANTIEKGYCIPILTSEYRYYWKKADRGFVWDIIKEILESPVKKVAQNANFDRAILAKHGIKVNNFWLDTMDAHYLVYPEFPKSLAFQTSIYTDQAFYKWMLKEDLFRYNCLDAMVTAKIALELVKELKEANMWKFYQKTIRPLADVSRKMQSWGIKIDIEGTKTRRKEVKKLIEKTQKQLDKEVGHPLNIQSPKQMVSLLYTELKLPKRYKNKSLTANKETLMALTERFKLPVLKKVLALKENKKILGTHLKAKVDKDGRMRTTYLVSGTETGHLSSHKNIPESIRDLYIPEEGCRFVSVSLPQAEARIVAHLSGDIKYVRFFGNDKDIYKESAAYIFECAESKVTKEQQRLLIRLMHAGNYDIGVRKFATIAGLTQPEAKKHLLAYYNMYPGIKEWHRETAHSLGAKRAFTTPLGRTCTFFDRWGDSLLRKAYAYVPQATVADYLNIGLVKLNDYLDEDADDFTIRTVLYLHNDFNSLEKTEELDTIILEVPLEYIPGMVKTAIKFAFDIPITIKGRTFTLPVSIKEGMSWRQVS